MRTRAVLNMTDGTTIVGDWKDDCCAETIIKNTVDFMKFAKDVPFLSITHNGLPHVIRIACVRDFYVETMV